MKQATIDWLLSPDDWLFSSSHRRTRDSPSNFLSTFTGTHFVTPRSYQLHVGVNF